MAKAILSIIYFNEFSILLHKQLATAIWSLIAVQVSKGQACSFELFKIRGMFNMVFPALIED